MKSLSKVPVKMSKKFDILSVAPKGSMWIYISDKGGCMWFEMGGQQIQPAITRRDTFTVVSDYPTYIGNHKKLSKNTNARYLKVIGPNSKIGYVIAEVFNEQGTWGKIVERINE